MVLSKAPFSSPIVPTQPRAHPRGPKALQALFPAQSKENYGGPFPFTPSTFLPRSRSNSSPLKGLQTGGAGGCAPTKGLHDALEPLNQSMKPDSAENPLTGLEEHHPVIIKWRRMDGVSGSIAVEPAAVAIAQGKATVARNAPSSHATLKRARESESESNGTASVDQDQAHKKPRFSMTPPAIPPPHNHQDDFVSRSAASVAATATPCATLLANPCINPRDPRRHALAATLARQRSDSSAASVLSDATSLGFPIYPAAPERAVQSDLNPAAEESSSHEAVVKECSSPVHGDDVDMDTSPQPQSASGVATQQSAKINDSQLPIVEDPSNTLFGKLKGVSRKLAQAAGIRQERDRLEENITAQQNAEIAWKNGVYIPNLFTGQDILEVRRRLHDTQAARDRAKHDEDTCVRKAEQITKEIFVPRGLRLCEAGGGPEEVAELKAQVHSLESQLSEARNEVAAQANAREADMKNLRDEFRAELEAIRGLVSAGTQAVAPKQDPDVELHEKVEALERELGENKALVEQLREEVEEGSRMQDGMKKAKKRQKAVEDRLSALEAQHNELSTFAHARPIAPSADEMQMIICERLRQDLNDSFAGLLSTSTTELADSLSRSNAHTNTQLSRLEDKIANALQIADTARDASKAVSDALDQFDRAREKSSSHIHETVVGLDARIYGLETAVIRVQESVEPAVRLTSDMRCWFTSPRAGGSHAAKA